MLQILHDQSGDQKSGNHKEHIHSHVAAGKPKIRMKKHYRQNSDSAQAVDLRTVTKREVSGRCSQKNLKKRVVHWHVIDWKRLPAGVVRCVGEEVRMNFWREWAFDRKSAEVLKC